MRKALYVIALGLMVLFTACNKENKADAPQPRPIPTMSQHTELSAVSADNGKQYSVIKIPTAVCASCEAAITKAVKKVEGVTDVKVNAKEHTAKVKFDDSKTNLEKIRIVISKTGYDADNVKTGLKGL